MKILLSPADAPATAPAASAAPATPPPDKGTPQPSTQPPATPARQPEPSKGSDPFGELTSKPKTETAPPDKEKVQPEGEADKSKGEKQKAKTGAEASWVRDLRKQHEEMKRELAEVRSQRDAQAEQLKKGDSSAMAKVLEQRESEIKQLRTELARYNYTQHPEFVEKYQKPFDSAARRAKTIIESLNVTENRDGEESSRRAEWKDFARLTTLDRHSAKAAAKQMFGDDAGDVMAQYDLLKDLREKSQTAAEEYAAKSDEMQAQERAQHLQQSERLSQAFKLATDDLIEGNPDKYGETPDNPERSALFKKALEVVDRAYGGQKLSLEEQVRYDAAIRLRAAHSVVLEKEVADLRAELEEFRAAANGKAESKGGNVQRQAPPPPADDPEVELKKAWA